MPRLSVLMIRAALLHLGIGFLFGGLVLFNKGIPFEGSLWRLLPVHIELLVFGWMLQLTMGVAFWIVPRFSSREGGSRYGRVWLAALAFVLLNVGIWIIVAGQWGSSLHMLLIGRVCILLSGGCFILHIVPRIKPLSISKSV